MTKHIISPVNFETYKLLWFGCKTLEVRAGFSKIKRIKTGDWVSFECHETDDYEVVRIARYRSFDSMLAVEDHSKIMPGLIKRHVHDHLRNTHTRLAEVILGMYVFELRNIGHANAQQRCMTVSG